MHGAKILALLVFYLQYTALWEIPGQGNTEILSLHGLSII